MAQVETEARANGRASQNEQGRTGRVSVILWVFLALALYVLSVGPAARLHDEGRIPGGVSLLYSPLIFLSEHSAAADRFFRWYVRDVWKAAY